MDGWMGEGWMHEWKGGWMGEGGMGGWVDGWLKDRWMRDDQVNGWLRAGLAEMVGDGLHGMWKVDDERKEQ